MINFDTLAATPRTWLITGVAGFIGSILLEALLRLDQRVVGLDNFATGHRRNLDEVAGLVDPERWGRFRFIEGDIRRLDDCLRPCEGVGRASVFVRRRWARCRAPSRIR